MHQTSKFAHRAFVHFEPFQTFKKQVFIVSSPRVLNYNFAPLSCTFSFNFETVGIFMQILGSREYNVICTPSAKYLAQSNRTNSAVTMATVAK